MREVEASFMSCMRGCMATAIPARDEAVQLRLRAAADGEAGADAEAGGAAGAGAETVAGTVFAGRAVRRRCFTGRRLGRDGGVGPAMVISGESTNLVPPGWTWRIDAAGTLAARRGWSEVEGGAR